ncbi:MAG TPA: ABC transporter permease [Pyrinomonadaceae bacterium]|jgi:predicted permease|nr:ABC transporter permease [Pyrinomonadaceae bacterium]
MNTLLKDVRYGVRSLLKRPAFALVAVIVLALGIGANTTVFSVMDAVMLRTLPVSHPEQIVEITTRTTGGGLHPDFSYPLYVAMRDSSPEFDGMLAYSPVTFGLSAGDQTERLGGEYVSGNYFDVLGVHQSIGSRFSPEDERPGASPVAVISYRLWNKRFGGDASVLQKTIALNGRTFSVIGVAPRTFDGLLRGMKADVWITLPHAAELENDQDRMANRGTSWLALAGRLKPEFTIKQAQALMAAHMPSGFEEARGSGNWDAVLTKASGGNEFTVSELSRPLTVLLVAVGLILAIACANIASLLLVRAQGRGREIGIRLALGASRWRVIRQLLIESSLLALVGGALGLIVAGWTSDLASGLRTTAGGALTLDFSLNRRVFLFNLGVSMLTVLLFGGVPALKASRLDLVPILKDSNTFSSRKRRRPSVHSVLVVTQVTLALILLAGAGLFLRSLGNLRSIDKGFKGDNVFAVSLDMELQGYDKSRGRIFYASVLDNVSALPGVQSVSLASALPVTAGGMRLQRPENGTKPAVNEPISIDVVRITPRFFETIGLPLLRGRDFQNLDTEKSTPTIIVNEAMARKFWPGIDPVGRTFNDGDKTLEIIGVARDTKYRNLREAPRMTMYRPLAQFYASGVNLLVRTLNDPETTIPAVQNRLHSLDPAIAVFNVRTLTEHVERSLYAERMLSSLLSTFGLLALVLTAVGIYGVIAFSVAQRTREVGIRMALGARKWDVLKLVLVKGFVLAAWGTAFGLIGSYWLSRLVSNQVYGVNAHDPATLATVVGLLIAVALMASYIPARRATKVDPLVALRYE